MDALYPRMTSLVVMVIIKQERKWFHKACMLSHHIIYIVDLTLSLDQQSISLNMYTVTNACINLKDRKKGKLTEISVFFYATFFGI